MTAIRTALVALLAVPLAGCIFLLDGDGDDDDCLYAALAEVVYHRNPDTGQCEERPGTRGDGDACTDGDYGGAEAPEPPSWGLCYAECEGLAEDQCQEAPGCRAAYLDDCPECTDAATPPVYKGCWNAAPGFSSVADPSECGGLDAYTCSIYDNCSPVHRTPCSRGESYCLEPAVGDFAYCLAEGFEAPPSCADHDEVECIGDGLCEPIYQGIDCICDETGACECAEWIFAECADASP